MTVVLGQRPLTAGHPRGSMSVQKGKYGCSCFLEGPPVVMGHHDTMLLHINTVLILMASFYRVGKIVPPLMIQVSSAAAQ